MLRIEDPKADFGRTQRNHSHWQGSEIRTKPPTAEEEEGIERGFEEGKNFKIEKKKEEGREGKG